MPEIYCDLRRIFYLYSYVLFVRLFRKENNMIQLSQITITLLALYNCLCILNKIFVQILNSVFTVLGIFIIIKRKEAKSPN